MGGALIAGAAVIVIVAVLGRVGSHTHDFVVAAQALPAGTTISLGDLSDAAVGAPHATAGNLFSDPSELIGRSLAVAAEPGQLIEASMLAPADGPALRPVDIPVASWSLAGLSPGQPVDVLAGAAAGDEADTSGATSAGAADTGGAATGPGTVIVRGADLLATVSQSSGLLSGTDSTTEVVTVGVTDLAEAEALVSAAQQSSVVLIRAEPSDGTGIGPKSG